MADDFAPTASWKVLRQRAELLNRVRAFFQQRSFLEVETPLLSRDTVIDRHLEPLQVLPPAASPAREDATPESQPRRLWLQTSPEFAMKRLLASGGPAIFQITHAFRGEEMGPLHNLEFTMAEWYRPGDGMAEGITLLSEFIAEMLGRGEAEAISYREAFRQLVALDPLTASGGELKQAAGRLAANCPNDWPADDRDLWLNFLLSQCVQPQLGTTSPVILYDYPASQAALAIVRDEDPPVAERFELFVDGVELANGYHELLDARELGRRNRQTNLQRRREGKRELPEDSRLLQAMEHGLPSCAGAALGLDRLLMMAVGADHIDQVLAFPFDRA